VPRTLAAAPTAWGDRAKTCDRICEHAHKNYIIFFRYVGDTCEIVNVLEVIGTSVRSFAKKP